MNLKNFLRLLVHIFVFQRRNRNEFSNVFFSVGESLFNHGRNVKPNIVTAIIVVKISFIGNERNFAFLYIFFNLAFTNVKKGANNFVLKVKNDGGNIDAITAATISSRAYCDAVNKAYNTIKSMIGGENNE